MITNFKNDVKGKSILIISQARDEYFYLIVFRETPQLRVVCIRDTC